MKTIFFKSIVITLLAFGFTGCTFNKQTDSTDQTGPEYTSVYVCPMHCDGSGSKTEGTCPVCGMDYVLNTKTKK